MTAPTTPLRQHQHLQRSATRHIGDNVPYLEVLRSRKSSQRLSPLTELNLPGGCARGAGPPLQHQPRSGSDSKNGIPGDC